MVILFGSAFVFIFCHSNIMMLRPEKLKMQLVGMLWGGIWVAVAKCEREGRIHAKQFFLQHCLLECVLHNQIRQMYDMNERV